MVSENPDHVEIDLLGGRQHAARDATFAGAKIRFGHPGQPERDATNRDRLGWANRDYLNGDHDGVIGHTTRLLRSGDATASQRAEALRLRAVSLASRRLHAAAVDDARAALEFDPEAPGPLGADDIRELLGYWVQIVS
jgi:hypothetical protein